VRIERRHGLVDAKAPHAQDDPRGFERALLSSLLPGSSAHSVGWNLRALQGCAQALRERLSPEAWRLIHEAAAQFEQHLRAVLDRPGPAAPVSDVLNVLARADTHLAAITGAQTDRMTRDDGWRLLSIGRQIERLSFHAEVLAEAFSQRSAGQSQVSLSPSGSVQSQAQTWGHSQPLALTEDGFALLLGVFDSTITYRAQFQARREAPPLLHLLVHNTDNPRSLAWVARTLRDRFAKLARHDPEWAAGIATELPVPEAWSLAELAAPGPALVTHLQRAVAQASELSSLISQRYFAHVLGAEQRVWQ